MKIYLTILLSFLLVPVLAFGAYTDVSISGSTIINIAGHSLTVSGTASIDSITVDTSSFSLTLSKGAEIVVTSTDMLSFGVYPVEYKKSFVCGSSNSTLTVGNANRDEAITVTVEPSSACSSGSSSSSGGGMIISGGGGGGGGGYTSPASSQVAAPLAVVPSAPATISVSVSPIFAKILNPGNISSNVKRLQQVLNSDPDTKVAVSGAGSSGKETTYFGSATTKALQKFQCKYNIVCSGTPKTTGYGNLGPKTRIKIQEVFKQK